MISVCQHRRRQIFRNNEAYFPEIWRHASTEACCNVYCKHIWKSLLKLKAKIKQSPLLEKLALCVRTFSNMYINNQDWTTINWTDPLVFSRNCMLLMRISWRQAIQPNWCGDLLLISRLWQRGFSFPQGLDYWSASGNGETTKTGLKMSITEGWGWTAIFKLEMWSEKKENLDWQMCIFTKTTYQ